MKTDNINLIVPKILQSGLPINNTARVSFSSIGTVSINDSMNVTSITDLGVGTFTVVFSSAMNNTNYIGVVCGNNTNAGDGFSGAISTSVNNPPKLLSQCYIRMTHSNGENNQDWGFVYVNIYGGI